MANSFRGGWQWTLGTGNPLANPQPQPSLTESLRAGVAMAHRGQMGSVPETQDLRDFRRTTPLKPSNIMPRPARESEEPSLLSVAAEMELRAQGKGSK